MRTIRLLLLLPLPAYAESIDSDKQRTELVLLKTRAVYYTAVFRFFLVSNQLMQHGWILTKQRIQTGISVKICGRTAW